MREKMKRPRIADLVPLGVSQIGRKTNGSSKHEPAARQGLTVSFDAGDGKKRVLITVNAEGGFEPVQWFGMRPTRDDRGLHEAGVVAAHGALILTEATWQAFMPIATEVGDDTE